MAKAGWPKRGAVGVGGLRRVPVCAVCVGVKGIAGNTHPIGSSARASTRASMDRADDRGEREGNGRERGD